MNIVDAITALEKLVSNPSNGLPYELFLYVSTLTPLVNVDLLVKDEIGRTLLSWRDDQYSGRGWHLPGGIVRVREPLEVRVRKVAETEIGSPIRFNSTPIAINQIIHDKMAIRGHFISILYQCSLSSSFVPSNKGVVFNDPGYLMWHERCPDDLLKYHEIYRKFL